MLYCNGSPRKRPNALWRPYNWCRTGWIKLGDPIKAIVSLHMNWIVQIGIIFLLLYASTWTSCLIKWNTHKHYTFIRYHKPWRAIETGVDVSVCVVEKGSEVGAHILSGNVFETRALVRSNHLFVCWSLILTKLSLFVFIQQIDRRMSCFQIGWSWVLLSTLKQERINFFI